MQTLVRRQGDCLLVLTFVAVDNGGIRDLKALFQQ